MVFGFLKRNKKENKSANTINSINSSSKSSSGFWEGCLSSQDYANVKEDGKLGNIETKKFIKIPFTDICNNMLDENYLKDVVKNDNDVHRRTAALFLLFHQSGSPDLLEFFTNLSGELRLSQNSAEELLTDAVDFIDAKGDAEISIEVDDNFAGKN